VCGYDETFRGACAREAEEWQVWMIGIEMVYFGEETLVGYPQKIVGTAQKRKGTDQIGELP